MDVVRKRGRGVVIILDMELVKVKSLLRTRATKSEIACKHRGAFGRGNERNHVTTDSKYGKLFGKLHVTLFGGAVPKARRYFLIHPSHVEAVQWLIIILSQCHHLMKSFSFFVLWHVLVLSHKL